jgi:hypothetical protein
MITEFINATEELIRQDTVVFETPPTSPTVPMEVLVLPPAVVVVEEEEIPSVKKRTRDFDVFLEIEQRYASAFQEMRQMPGDVVITPDVVQFGDVPRRLVKKYTGWEEQVYTGTKWATGICGETTNTRWIPQDAPYVVDSHE